MYASYVLIAQPAYASARNEIPKPEGNKSAGLERAVDIYEDAGDRRAKQHQRRDDYDGYEGNDERVLDKSLASL